MPKDALLIIYLWYWYVPITLLMFLKFYKLRNQIRKTIKDGSETLFQILPYFNLNVPYHAWRRKMGSKGIFYNLNKNQYLSLTAGVFNSGI